LGFNLRNLRNLWSVFSQVINAYSKPIAMLNSSNIQQTGQNSRNFETFTKSIYNYCMVTLYLSLGSNLGDRWHHMQRAVWELRPFMTITRLSPVYETIPWGPIQDQPCFLNACLQAETYLPLDILLRSIKQLEHDLGRDQTEKFGPHEIDIDLLFYGDLVRQLGERTVPHRQIRERPFVLVPLADIAPDFLHPVHQMTVTELLAEVKTDSVFQLPGMLITDPVAAIVG